MSTVFEKFEKKHIGYVWMILKQDNLYFMVMCKESSERNYQNG